MSRGEKGEKGRQSYSSISVPARLLEEIEKLVKVMGYWPTKTAFIREACLEKMEKHRKELEARRLAEEAVRAGVT